MTGRQRAAKVAADYSQYWVAAGPDIDEPRDLIPGLLVGLGSQAVAVITGLQWGDVTVTARAVPEPCAEVDPGWDMVAETDLDCPEGMIAVCDWAGPGHDEVGELAINGPGRYRLRVHVRGRDHASVEQSAEEHHLLVWPAVRPAPSRLLTPMDAFGRVFIGEEEPDAPPLNAVDLAAAAAVRQLADLVNRPGPPGLSGGLTAVHAETVAPATPRRVWDQVSIPWHWVGLGGGYGYDIYLSNEPKLNVEGRFVFEEPPLHLVFTWSWSVNRWQEADVQVPYAMSRDLITGEVTELTRTERGRVAAPSWMLPARPTTVDIRLRRHGKGTTAVELEHRDLPVELASLIQSFWDWALRELHRRLTNAPFYGHPWDR